MQSMRSQLGRHTFSMDPQERPLRFPFCKCFALQEPCCRSTMSCLPKKVVIRRRVRGRKPVFDVPSQLVTYKILSVSATKGREKTTNASFCLSHLSLDEWRLRIRVSTVDTCSTRDTYPTRVELYPLTPRHLMEPDSASAWKNL
jgi:hypothetical protein